MGQGSGQIWFCNIEIREGYARPRETDVRAAGVEVSNSEWLGWRGVAGTGVGCRVQGAGDGVKGAEKGSEPVTGPANDVA